SGPASAFAGPSTNPRDDAGKWTSAANKTEADIARETVRPSSTRHPVSATPANSSTCSPLEGRPLARPPVDLPNRPHKVPSPTVGDSGQDIYPIQNHRCGSRLRRRCHRATTAATRSAAIDACTECEADPLRPTRGTLHFRI